jgi:glycosyltransferase involved in cell wall biosynthesis
MDIDMEPLVSILIPAYNAQDTIAQTLITAVRQPWRNKEIIVVDDGSKDDTRSIVESFAGDGVVLVTQPNQGAAAARNKAFAVSHGEYINWLDADDLLAPDKIGLQMRALGEQPNRRTVASGSWAHFFHRPSRANFIPSGLWCDLSPLEWLLRKMEQNVYMQTATWLVPRQLTEAAGPWDTTLLGDDDGEYFCRVLLLCDTVRFVPEAKVYYRLSGSKSLSYIGHSNKKMEAQLRSMRLHISYIRSLDDSPRVRKACVKYLQTWLINFYPERLDLVDAATELASELGGELKTPTFSWKYAALAATCGPQTAKRAQILLPHMRWSLVERWDRMMYRLQPESV